MSRLSEADAYLLEQVRAGEAEGWSELVNRYQGRLLAFGLRHLGNRQDAEDTLQETLVAFLQGLGRFHGEASLETYLFSILRRKIIDALRGRKVRICQAGVERASLPEPSRATGRADMSASWYVRRDEAEALCLQALGRGLEQLVAKVHEGEDFQTLAILEALFYAGLRNKETARLLGVSENLVALVKHRSVKQLGACVQSAMEGGSEGAAEAAGMLLGRPMDAVDDLLRRVWEEQRPSCPKRSTLGRFLLGTLDEPWREHVQFHVEVLGCGFCAASLTDLREQTEQAGEPRLQERLFQSTVGFLRKG